MFTDDIPASRNCRNAVEFVLLNGCTCSMQILLPVVITMIFIADVLISSQVCEQNKQYIKQELRYLYQTDRHHYFTSGNILKTERSQIHLNFMAVI